MIQQQCAQCVCTVGIIMCYLNSPSTCQGCSKQQHLTLSAVWDDAKLYHFCIVTISWCCISIYLPLQNYSIVFFTSSYSEVFIASVVGNSKVGGEDFDTLLSIPDILNKAAAAKVLCTDF